MAAHKHLNGDLFLGALASKNWDQLAVGANPEVGYAGLGGKSAGMLPNMPNQEDGGFLPGGAGPMNTELTDEIINTGGTVTKKDYDAKHQEMYGR